MIPHGTEAIARALTRRVPALPLDEPVWEWAVGGATGAGVSVAIVDSGIDSRHPDIAHLTRSVVVERREGGETAVSDDEDHVDLVGHGTACAAIVRSLAPDVELTSVRVLDGELRGHARVFADGLEWAIDHGAQVVNLSLSTSNESWYGVLHEIADLAYFRNVILVCALNNVPRASYPSEFSSVVSVAALPASEPGVLAYNPEGPAEFGAPGIDVRVAWLDGGHATVTGNSFASPYVAGLAALIRSKHPWVTPFQAKAVLQAMATNASAP